MSEANENVEGGNGNSGMWWVIGLAVASSVFAGLYHGLKWVGWGNSAAMFLGLPAVLAILLALTPKAKTITGGIVRGITFVPLIVAPLLGEGYLCIRMAAPLFYLVGVIIGLLSDWLLRRGAGQGGTVACVVVVLLPMCMEGVVPSMTFDRRQMVEVTRVVAGSAAQVERALAESPRLETPLPRYLRIGFPRPLEATGGGLELGAMRTLHFSGAEGDPAGDLVMRVTARGPGYVRTEAMSDGSKLTQWMKWDSSEVEWRAVDAGHTRVTWRIGFERELDPAWYFTGWERAAVQMMAALYMIAANATPVARAGGGEVNDAAWTRVAALYVPVMAALLAGLLRGRRPRMFAACLLSLLWACGV